MSWKDYFAFNRSEQIAICILLTICIISGIIYRITLPTDAEKDYNTDSKGFAEFEAKLKIKESRQEKANAASYKYKPVQKLKAGETIDLNSADTTNLKRIPGIGSGYAGRIDKYRNLLGGYASVTQLKEVWGMDDYLFEDIQPYIVVTTRHRLIDINNASFDQLAKHPYINSKQAAIIIDLRERKGNITSIQRLGLLDEFTGKDIERLKPYLRFD